MADFFLPKAPLPFLVPCQCSLPVWFLHFPCRLFSFSRSLCPTPCLFTPTSPPSSPSLGAVCLPRWWQWTLSLMVVSLMRQVAPVLRCVYSLLSSPTWWLLFVTYPATLNSSTSCGICPFWNMSCTTSTGCFLYFRFFLWTFRLLQVPTWIDCISSLYGSTPVELFCSDSGRGG